MAPSEKRRIVVRTSNNTYGLLSLPSELVVAIARSLNDTDLFMLLLTCTEAHALWEQLRTVEGESKKIERYVLQPKLCHLFNKPLRMLWLFRNATFLHVLFHGGHPVSEFVCKAMYTDIEHHQRMVCYLPTPNSAGSGLMHLPRLSRIWFIQQHGTSPLENNMCGTLMHKEMWFRSKLEELTNRKDIFLWLMGMYPSPELEAQMAAVGSDCDLLKAALERLLSSFKGPLLPLSPHTCNVQDSERSVASQDPFNIQAQILNNILFSIVQSGGDVYRSYDAFKQCILRAMDLTRSNYRKVNNADGHDSTVFQPKRMYSMWLLHTGLEPLEYHKRITDYGTHGAALYFFKQLALAMALPLNPFPRTSVLEMAQLTLYRDFGPTVGNVGPAYGMPDAFQTGLKDTLYLSILSAVPRMKNVDMLCHFNSILPDFEEYLRRWRLAPEWLRIAPLDIDQRPIWGATEQPARRHCENVQTKQTPCPSFAMLACKMYTASCTEVYLFIKEQLGKPPDHNLWAHLSEYYIRFAFGNQRPQDCKIIHPNAHAMEDEDIRLPHVQNHFRTFGELGMQQSFTSFTLNTLYHRFWFYQQLDTHWDKTPWMHLVYTVLLDVFQMPISLALYTNYFEYDVRQLIRIFPQVATDAFEFAVHNLEKRKGKQRLVVQDEDACDQQREHDDIYAKCIVADLLFSLLHHDDPDRAMHVIDPKGLNAQPSETALRTHLLNLAVAQNHGTLVAKMRSVDFNPNDLTVPLAVKTASEQALCSLFMYNLKDEEFFRKRLDEFQQLFYQRGTNEVLTLALNYGVFEGTSLEKDIINRLLSDSAWQNAARVPLLPPVPWREIVENLDGSLGFRFGKGLCKPTDLDHWSGYADWVRR